MLPAVARVFFSRGSLFEEGMGLMSYRLFGKTLGTNGPDGPARCTLARPAMVLPVIASSLAMVMIVALCFVVSPAFAASPPVVEDQYALNVAGTSATLGATVNPEGSVTSYRFEYGPSAGYGASTPEANAGSSLTGASLQAHLQGLSPATVYHYRVVASNEGGTVDGVDQTFTTQGVGGEFSLPDGRQWEMVSSPNKHGAPITPIAEVGLVQAADDGHAIAYSAEAPTELEPEGFSSGVEVLSTRGSQEWSSQEINVPHRGVTGASIGSGYEYRFFSPDLSRALVEPFGLFTPLSPEATERTPYIRNDIECAPAPSTCFTPLLTAGNVSSGVQFGAEYREYGRGEASFVSASKDLRHIVLHSEVPLTGMPGEEGGLYEWTGGRLQLVSILPADEGGTPEKFGQLGYPGDTRNAISSDGSRVFWTSSTGVYMRDLVKEETVHIVSGYSRYVTANDDGSRVFFASQAGAFGVCDIVEVAGKLECRSAALAPDIQGTAVGTSDDGSYVYFVSDAALASGAVSGTCESSSEASDLCNLYVVHGGAAGWESPKLVGVLSASDRPDWGGFQGELQGTTARVSPGGRWLAFMSQRDLTGYDTHDVVTGQPAEEVYLYDAGTGRLTCASCDPTGGRPVGTLYGLGFLGGVLGGGDRVWESDAMLAANIPGWTPYAVTEALYQSRYLSENGRLFFNSGNALVPQDVNGTWDVYEYEPPEVGNCTVAEPSFSARSGGCVGLVSSGGSADQSAFIDASESGDDVFFLTTSHLASRDFDTSYDVYDAHVCSTSEPCVSSSVSPPSCSTGDSCKAAPSPQPTAFGAPSSATFAGIGNVAEVSERSASRSRSLSRAQKLKRALKACRRKKGKRRRAMCESKARKLYRAKKATRGSK